MTLLGMVGLAGGTATQLIAFNECGLKIDFYLNIEQPSTDLGSATACVARKTCWKLNIEYFELPCDMRHCVKARWFWRELREKCPIVVQGMRIRWGSLPCVDNIHANIAQKEIYKNEEHTAVGGKDGYLIVMERQLMVMLRELGYPEAVGVGEQPTQHEHDVMM